jgi:hypothetical protein
VKSQSESNDNRSRTAGGDATAEGARIVIIKVMAAKAAIFSITRIMIKNEITALYSMIVTVTKGISAHPHKCVVLDYKTGFLLQPFNARV